MLKKYFVPKRSQHWPGLRRPLVVGPLIELALGALFHNLAVSLERRISFAGNLLDQLNASPCAATAIPHRLNVGFCPPAIGTPAPSPKLVINMGGAGREWQEFYSAMRFDALL